MNGFRRPAYNRTRSVAKMILPSYVSASIPAVATFSDLFARLDPDPRVRGKQFEHVCKWFLTNDPMYKNTLRRVWLWCEWTGRWGGVILRWLRGVGLSGATIVVAIGFAGSAPAAVPPTPGMQVKDEDWKCTAGFAAQGYDGGYYLFTSGHCNHPEGSLWTYEQGVPLGKITASEEEGDRKDAAIIRLDPGVGVPVGDVGGRPVRDVWGASQIQVGTPFCKLGAITGETCGAIKNLDGELLVASVHAKPGDSGSAGFVKNADGTVSAVGVLSGSLDGDENTTVFVLVQPLLDRWGLRLLP